MRIVLIIIILISLSYGSVAQNCSLHLSGRILSTEGLPIESVMVRLLPNNVHQVTDASGKFLFEQLCANTYSISIRHIGFVSKEDKVNLTTSREITITLESHVEELEAIVIHEEAHQEGLTVSGLNRAELDAVAGKSLGETLREISGVGTIQAGPGISKPVIHGVYGQRILILNNGVRLEGQQWGAEHAPEIDPFIAADIQVIKDASSIRHGVDAIGGVVMVNPPQLPETPGLGGYFQNIGQTNGRVGIISGSLQGGIKGASGWGWRVQGTGKKAGDYSAANYQLTNTGLRESNFSGAVGYHHEKGGFEIFSSYFSTDVGILSGSVSSSVGDLADAISAEVPRYTKPFSYAISNPRQAVVHQLIKMNGHYAGKNGTWRWMYAWQQNNRQEYDLRRSGLSELPAIDLKLNTHTIETEWEDPYQKNAHWRLGANGQYQYNTNVYGTQRIPFIPDYTSLTGGLYSIVNRESGAVKMDAGLRYDVRYYDVAGYDFKNTLYHQKLLFHNVSATAGISMKIQADRSWMMSLSSAWRPPHVSELFSLGTHQSAAAIEYGLFLDPLTNEIRDRNDVDFRNEQSIKWVTGLKSSKDSFSYELTGYMNYVFNYFFLRPGGITRNIRGAYPYYRYTQTNALFLGLDWESNWRPIEHTMVAPRLSLIWAQDQTNKDYLMFIPANRLELNFRRELFKKENNQSFFIEIKNRYVFKQFRAPRVIEPDLFLDDRQAEPLLKDDRIFDFMAAPDGYFLIGATAGLVIPSDKIRYDFRVTGENLFNKAYREYTNRFRYFADEVGRNISLSIKMIF